MKKILIAFFVFVTSLSGFAQKKEVTLPTESDLGSKFSNTATMDKGFFFATELNGGYSIDSHDNFGSLELDFTGGYRFGEYFRTGLGLGVRFYTNNPSNYRYAPSKFAMPLFVNFRGNFIPSDYRSIVPYWSLDTGVVFPDGFMFRPSFGIRIGQERSAFLLALTYTGNAIRTIKDDGNTIKHKYRSFLGLKVGYEF